MLPRHSNNRCSYKLRYLDKRKFRAIILVVYYQQLAISPTKPSSEGNEETTNLTKALKAKHSSVFYHYPARHLLLGYKQ
jgi:hypothetical protein